MKQAPAERSTPVPAPAATIEPGSQRPHRRERHTWRLVVGLTGLLGVAWAVAIASRYPSILPG